MRIGFQKFKWMLCLAFLPATPALSSSPTPILKKAVLLEIPNPAKVKPSQDTKEESGTAAKERDSENIPILKDRILPKNPSPPSTPTKIPPKLGQIPQTLKEDSAEKPTPALGQISENLRQNITKQDPHIPEELPEELKDLPLERIPPSLGQFSEGLRQIIMEKDLYIPEELPEELKEDSPKKPAPALEQISENSLDALMFMEKQNQEIQSITQLLMQAIERGNSEHYRILIKYILMSYSPLQVLSTLHSVQEKSENTLIHLLAKTSSGKLIHELRNLIEAFLPFVRKQGFFSGIRASFTPKEFKKISSGEPGTENLWAMEVPVDLESMALVQALQGENLPAYQEELISELIKPGNMRRFLAALHGNTQTGKSIYDFMEHVQSNNPEFAQEAEILAKWFTLPLYRTNRTGLTPLLIARKMFKKKGLSEAFVILSMAETELGITTEVSGGKFRWKGRGKTAIVTALGISCLLAFQNME